MQYLSKDELLAELPLMLAGPILRRTEPESVTVWMALQRPCQVHLQIFETEENGARITRCVLQGRRDTVAIGKRLHVVAVSALSARQEDAIAPHRDCLQRDRLYAYDLTFHTSAYTTAQTSTQSTAQSTAQTSTQSAPSNVQTIDLAGALSQARHDNESISYFAHQKPTFSLPPTQLDQLKIVHGSCRKPHGRGYDALSILDCLLETKAADPNARPQQLFLTGDQIYGDDVADPLLWLATPLGDALLGWEEKLPISQKHDQPFSGSFAKKTRPKSLPAGARAEVATEKAGFTAGLTNKPERTTSHLFSFGEYCAAYLLAYSPACWPTQLPIGKTVTTGRKRIRHWNSDKRNMEQFLHSLWKVRRLLANIATYTIFDDHDVSDDWNLNQAWCLKILGQPLGYRTVQNAMLAYAICQAWGNTPEQFVARSSRGRASGNSSVGSALLLAAQRWSQSEGEDTVAHSNIAAYLGLPLLDAHTGLPAFIEDKKVWVFKRSEETIRWHYTVRSACHEVLVLDTRTWRGYPIDAEPIAPPMLLSPTAFQQQLSDPLVETRSQLFSQPSVQEASADGTNSPSTPAPNTTNFGTFVIAPTNVFGMRPLDWIQQWHLDQKKVFTADVGDSWNFHDGALATLLTTLMAHRDRVIILSGDIHYSSAIQVAYQDRVSGDHKQLIQLTCSAIKNEELLTEILHTRLKDWLLPEKDRRWLGWSAPPDMAEVHSKKARLFTRFAAKQQKAKIKRARTAPDWQCHMQWLPREPATPVAFISNANSPIPEQSRPRFKLLEWFKFWRTRWFQEGTEVVGRNNIAVVQVQASAPAQSSSEPAEFSVQQDHYWFSPWQPIQVVRSCFRTKP